MSRRALLGSRRSEASAQYNTYIGGIAGTINSASALASRIQKYPNYEAMPLSSIQDFTIVGSDIYCNITEHYIAYNAGAFDSCTGFIDSDNHLKRIYGAAVFQGANMNKLELNGLIDVLGYRPFNIATINEINLPNLTHTNTDAFASNAPGGGQASDINILRIPLCTNLGGSTANNSCFIYTANGMTVYANSILQTNNSGAPDGDLQYLVSNGGSVIYL